jgi:hypothetical protein
VLFASAPALLADLVKAHAEGRFDERLAFYTKPKLLIIDELGYLPFDPNAVHLFFQLVSRRYEHGSLVVTSNRSVGRVGDRARRSRRRYRHPRSPAPSQPCRHHPRPRASSSGAHRDRGSPMESHTTGTRR